MSVTTIPTAGIADGAVTVAKATGFGKIGAVSTLDLTSTYSTASSSLTASGISINITPSATTSKVLLILSCNMYINSFLQRNYKSS